MKVFILGATGLIGSAVTREFLATGHRVIGLCRSDTAVEKLRAMGATAQRGDMKQPEAWSDLVRDVDVVIQAAATFEDDMGDVDRAVMEALVNSARRADVSPRLIYTGGVWRYGDTGGEVAEETGPIAPISAFRWMEDNVAFLTSGDVFRVTFLHPAMVYGDGCDGAFAQFAEAARNGNLPEIWGNADLHWPLVHVDDLARAYRLVASDPDGTGSFNVVAQQGVSVGEIATAVASAHGLSGDCSVHPAAQVVAQNGDWAYGPMLDQKVSARRLKQRFGWQPRYCDYRAHLRSGRV